MTQTARDTAGASTTTAANANASTARTTGLSTGTPNTDGSLAAMVALATIPILMLVAVSYPAAAAGFVAGLLASGARAGWPHRGVR